MITQGGDHRLSHGVPDYVAHYARTQPHAAALHNHDSGETRTWAELDERVGQLAHALRHKLGLEPGDRIVSLTNGDMRYFEMQFACFRAGVILAPLNFRYTVRELVDNCVDLHPRLMITDHTWGKIACEVAAQAYIPKTLSWEAGEGLDQLLDANLAIREQLDIHPDAALLILFTSGTTGKPKAAVITNGGLIWQAMNQMQFAGVSKRNAHIFVPIPLFHAGGISTFANPILFFGGKVTVAARFDAEEATNFVGDPKHAVTHLALVPVMYKMMTESEAFKTADFRFLSDLSVGGGRLPEAVREDFAKKGAHFTTQYGGTETGPTITAMNVERSDKVRAGSCGQKVMFVQVRLVDENGEDVPIGQPGEVRIKGPAVINQYFNRDPAVDFPDGWFHTGDVAWKDEEGFYYIVDRVKDMYKSGGENVYPAEIEYLLQQHESISEVAVIGVADEKWSEVGLAVVVPAKGYTMTIEKIQAICEGNLARFKHPKHLVLLDALPRNVTGKIEKQTLRAKYKGSRSA